MDGNSDLEGRGLEHWKVAFGHLPVSMSLNKIIF